MPTTAGILTIVFAFWSSMNVIFSLLVLWLIFSMKLKINQFLKVIVTLTGFQLLFDTSLLLNTCRPNNLTCDLARNFLGLFCGLETSLWTCYLSLICLYIVWSKKSLDTNGIYPFIFVLFFLVSLGFGINGLALLLIGDEKNIANLFIAYNTIKFGVNLIVFLVYFTCLIEVRKLVSTQNRKRDPLNQLTRRLLYYPLVQVFSQTGMAIYTYCYPRDIAQARGVPLGVDISPMEIFVLSLEILTLPCCGIGYLLIFLLVQKGAKQHFLKRVFLLSLNFVYSERSSPSPSPSSSMQNTSNEKLESSFNASTQLSILHSHAMSISNLDKLFSISSSQSNSQNSSTPKDCEDMDEEELVYEIQRKFSKSIETKTNDI